MVDIHSHILPMVDDGAQSWEVAVTMVTMAERDGVTHMVATPHANDEYAYDRESHRALIEELQNKVGSGVQLILGCDFHFSYDNLEDALRHPNRYTIGNTRYLLIEFSDFSIPPQISDMLFSLTSKRLIPILTHPERNRLLQRDPKRVSEWVDMGLLVQLTASAFTGKWGESVRQLAHWYTENQLVHVIASDAHNANRRNPVLSEAREVVAKTYSEDFADRLFDTNPRAIINDETVVE